MTYRKHSSFQLAYRPCWLCNLYINPEAPAGHSERVEVDRFGLDAPLKVQIHAHCHDLHRVAATREKWLGRLSRLNKEVGE